MNVVDIPMEEIFSDDKFNCRGKITPIDVVDLMRDIEEDGLLTPIQIQKYDKELGFKYRIIAGHRRHKACELLEKETMSCVIMEVESEAKALKINLTENLLRKNLNVMQEARALQRLKNAGLSEHEVADQLQASRGWVQIRYLLLGLPKEIQEEVEAGTINQPGIRQLYQLRNQPEAQMDLALAMKKAKLKGEKAPISPPKNNPFQKKHRGRVELYQMLGHVMDSIGPNFGTRCLAWAGGEISNVDLYRDIAEIAKAKNISYEIPVASEAIASL